MNPYQVLGVSPLTPKKEIKKRYKELAKKYHPDVGGDASRFREIKDAWEFIDENQSSESSPDIWVHKTLFTFKKGSQLV